MKRMIILMICISLGFASEGKIGGVTYFDYTNSKEKSAFDFKRQYFSYGVNVSDDVNFKVIFDVGSTLGIEIDSLRIGGIDKENWPIELDKKHILKIGDKSSDFQYSLNIVKTWKISISINNCWRVGES